LRISGERFVGSASSQDFQFGIAKQFIDLIDRGLAYVALQKFGSVVPLVGNTASGIQANAS
jgi:hypothetical protein